MLVILYIYIYFIFNLIIIYVLNSNLLNLLFKAYILTDLSCDPVANYLESGEKQTDSTYPVWSFNTLKHSISPFISYILTDLSCDPVAKYFESGEKHRAQTSFLKD